MIKLLATTSVVSLLVVSNANALGDINNTVNPNISPVNVVAPNISPTISPRIDPTNVNTNVNSFSPRVDPRQSQLAVQAMYNRQLQEAEANAASRAASASSSGGNSLSNDTKVPVGSSIGYSAPSLAVGQYPVNGNGVFTTSTGFQMPGIGGGVWWQRTHLTGDFVVTHANLIGAAYCGGDSSLTENGMTAIRTWLEVDQEEFHQKMWTNRSCGQQANVTE